MSELQEIDDLYCGRFRLCRGYEVLVTGGMNEIEVTELAAKIPGTHIEHQDPVSEIWEIW